MADGGYSGGCQRKPKLPVTDSQEQTLAGANLDGADLATVLLAKVPPPPASGLGQLPCLDAHTGPQGRAIPQGLSSGFVFPAGTKTMDSGVTWAVPLAPPLCVLSHHGQRFCPLEVHLPCNKSPKDLCMCCDGQSWRYRCNFFG